MSTHYSAELVRRCQERNLQTVVTLCSELLGQAIDAGVLTLEEVLAIVRSCNDAAELGDSLAMLAGVITVATAKPSGRVFRVVGGDW